MTLLLALLTTLSAFAQDYEYVPFVREGVKWVCDAPYSEWMQYHHCYFTMELAGDTVIDGIVYKAMHKYSGDAINEMNDTIPVYLREENKVVYGIVPDGKTYTECPVGMNWWPEAQEIIQSGQEFILYDFNDPINFIKNNVRYPIEGSPYGYFVDAIISDQIVVADIKRNRYIFSGSCFIEGIGCDGLFSGYPLSARYELLCYVIENGDTIYTSKRLEEQESYAPDYVELPIPRQGVQWVNERVIIENGDTTSQYYKYEFRGYDSQGFANCYTYTGETLGGSAASVAAQYQSWSYGLNTSNGMIRHNTPYNKVLKNNRNLMYFGSSIGDDYLEMYHFLYYATDIDPGYTPNWYIYRQKESFLTRENLVEVEPLVIEEIKCKRFAYIGEQGDTLAYIVQGIGFDSRDMGDLLTPFTRKPDPDADYQEYWGLSHVIKDGKIIYKGMRYNPALFDDPDDDYEYVPFVREGVKWVYFYDNSDDIINPDYEPGKHYFNLELKGDTVINGKTYKAMHKYSGTSINWENDTVPVYLREENKIVYGIIPEKQKYDDCPVGNVYDFYGSFYNGQEFVLYDFADPITFWNVNYNDYLYVPAINYQTTDTISLGNKLTKRYVWTHANMKYFYQVEGVGTDAEINGYTLYPYKDISPGMSNVYFWLSHVVENGKTIYKGIHYDPALFDNPGDVNGDGEINIGDTNSVIDVIINGGGAGTGGHSRIPACDVNGDGEVNIADVNAIIELIIGN